jgi:hypothetical protein
MRHLLLFVVLFAVQARAAVVDLLGNKASWTTSWTPVTGVSDGKGDFGSAKVDLVGDASDPLAYWGKDASHAYFRFRLATGTVSGASDFDGSSYFVFINKAGSSPDHYPQYAISWDGQQNHYLELNTVPTTTYTTWSQLDVEDHDGNRGQKLADDINGGGRTTDGYARVVDQQSTAAFGPTTFFEIAISWDYLSSQNTGLAPDQTWRLAFGTLNSASEHAGPKADVAGGSTLDFSINNGWSADITPVPEMPAAPAVVLLLAGLAGYSRHRSRARGHPASRRL